MPNLAAAKVKKGTTEIYLKTNPESFCGKYHVESIAYNWRIRRKSAQPLLMETHQRCEAKEAQRRQA